MSENVIRLNRFVPRNYQLNIIDALENKGYKRLLWIVPRRAGKDVVCFNLMLRAAIKTIGVYYYIFPTYSQARKVIFDSITNEGVRFLDFIPKELVLKINQAEMKIYLINGSIMQLIGSDHVDGLVGTNPIGIVFSEYALQDPNAYYFLRPILLVNNGWAIFQSTPRSHNHFYELYNIALNSKEWFVEKLSVVDTKHISEEDIEKEKSEGIMSEDLIRQEYYCDFDVGTKGLFYADYINQAQFEGRISKVPWDPSFKVNTAWDIGVRDSTAIIFFQVCGQVIKIIDCYENSQKGLDHYIHFVKSKPYIYDRHIAPHDMRVKEFSLGITRWEKARELGITFAMADKLFIMDGIEAVRSTLPRCWFDEVNTKRLVTALENYKQEFDHTKGSHKGTILHDRYSHFADAFRYLAVYLPRIRKGMTQEDVQKSRARAIYGGSGNNPIFNNSGPRGRSFNF